MQTGSFELNIAVPSHGRSTKIREFGHEGRTYVEGRKGQPFSILFRNSSAERILAVLSVDGVSVLDGKGADNDSSGYVVNAYSNLEVKGWRTSLDDVAQFFFETKDGSYASAGPVGDARNCGVIGCRVIGEDRPQVVHVHHLHPPYIKRPLFPCPVYDDDIYYVSGGGNVMRSTYTTNTSQAAEGTANYYSGELKAAFNSSAQVEKEAPKAPVAAAGLASAPDFNLGAGYGTSLVDKVYETSFKRGAVLAVLEIFYTDADGLVKAGVDLRKTPAVSRAPSAFPAAFNGFCQPPAAR